MSQLSRILMVKESERRLLAYFFLFFVLLGVGLALGRGSADALFFKRYGIENLPIVYAVLGGGLAVTSLVYAAYADRIPSERFFLFLFVGLVFLVSIVWFLIRQGQTQSVFPVYFLLFEIGSELLPLHAMLYVSQNLETMQAKRLIPIILAGSQIGRIAGGAILVLVVPLMGVPNVLLLWVAISGLSLWLLWRHHRRSGVSPYYRRIRRSRNLLRQAVEQVHQGLRFSRRSRLIRASFVSLFFMVMSFYILSYGVNLIYTQHFPTEESLGRFFGLLAAATSGLALFVQLFVTGRLLDRFGVKRTNLIYPVTSISVYIVLIVSFTLPAAILASFHKDSLTSAVRAPTRSLFFNVLPDYMQGRARALSLALVMPTALVIAGGMLVWMQKSQEPAIFLVAGLIATVLYLLSNIRMNAAYVQTLMATLRERVFLPNRKTSEAGIGEASGRVVDELIRGVRDHNDSASYAYAQMLLASHPNEAHAEIVKRFANSTNSLRDRFVGLLTASHIETVSAIANALPADFDDHLRATIFTALFNARDMNSKPRVAECLASDNPRLAVVGILGVQRYAMHEYAETAEEKLKNMLTAVNPSTNMAALELLQQMPEAARFPDLVKLMACDDPRVQHAALKVLASLPAEDYPGLPVALESLYRSLRPEIRAACVSCYRLLNDTDRHRLTLQALEDSHPQVRRAALEVLLNAGNDVKEAAIPWILENAGSPRAEEMLLQSLLHESLPKGIFVRIALEKANYAYELHCALQLLEREAGIESRSGFHLLQIVLGERILQVINLCLTALKASESAEVIGIIQAGLASGDNRQVANAREAMHNLRHNKIIKLLDDLLNRDLRNHRTSEGAEVRFTSLHSMLEWCSNRPDPWLNEVARHISV